MSLRVRRLLPAGTVSLCATLALLTPSPALAGSRSFLRQITGTPTGPGGAVVPFPFEGAARARRGRGRQSRRPVGRRRARTRHARRVRPRRKLSPNCGTERMTLLSPGILRLKTQPNIFTSQVVKAVETKTIRRRGSVW